MNNIISFSSSIANMVISSWGGEPGLVGASEGIANRMGRVAGGAAGTVLTKLRDKIQQGDNQQGDGQQQARRGGGAAPGGGVRAAGRPPVGGVRRR
jgi:hypothetical protein